MSNANQGISSEKKIIALVGMAGAGKSSVVDVLTEQYKLPRIYFGGITMEEVRQRGLPENQENEKKVRLELRAKYGMSAYAQLSIPKIEKHLENSPVVILDGLYSWSEYTLLKKHFSCPLLLVSVIARRETRYQRLSTRKERSLSPKEAEKRDFSEIEDLEKGGPIALCDYYIGNDGSPQDLEKQIHQLTSEWRVKKP